MISTAPSPSPTTRPAPARARRALAAGLLAVLVASSIVALGASPAAAAVAPVLWTDVTALELAPTTIGSTSAFETVPFRNAGPGTASGLTVVIEGSTELQLASSTCGPTLAAGTSCAATVRFVPTTGMLAEGAVVLSGSGGVRRRVALTGRPEATSTPLRVTSTGLDFGPVAVNAASATRSILITNPTAFPTPLVISQAPVSTASFIAVADSCGSVLAAFATCSLGFRFRPGTAGPHELRSGVTVSAAGGAARTYPVVFRGHGGAGGPVLAVSPTGLDFGRVGIGEHSAPQAITVTNTSATTQTIGSLGIDTTRYDVAFGCLAALAPGASCQLDVVARPAELGLQVRRHRLTLHLPEGRVHSVPLDLSVTATGSQPRLRIHPQTVDFGPLPVGATPATRTVTVTNTGTGPAQGLTVEAQGASPQPVLTGTTCGATLAASASCVVNLRYTPTTTARVFRPIEIDATALQPQELGVWGGRRLGVEEAWIAYLIGRFFERLPVGSEATDLARAIEAGTITRTAAAGTIVTGEEFVGQLVQRFYLDTLGRYGEAAGVRYWVGEIRAGRRTIAQVAASFYASPEYFEGLGGGTARTWVADVYEKLLLRPAEPAGLDYWVGEVARQGRTRVALRFYETPESRGTRVLFLHGLVGLQPTDTEVAAGRTRLGQIGDLGLMAELAATAPVVRAAQDGDR